MNALRGVLLAILLCAPVLAASGQEEPTPVNELPEVKELANPFVFLDGSRVETPEDWDRRRAEVKQLFEEYQYGSLPPKPEAMTITPGDVLTNDTLGVTTQDFVLHMEHEGNPFDLHMRLSIPLETTGKLPVVIQSGYGGGPEPPRRFGPPREGPPGPSIFTTRGYATAAFQFSEAAADNKETARQSGIYQLYGDDIDTGGLMAWAWGVHRVLDALETVDRIDMSQVVVTGHSRNGKAALVAGAFDERIALTVPSHSGTAGAAPYRFIYGESEQLHNIVGYAPQWFRPDFDQFIENVHRLPVDQHLLKALIAPRALMGTEGTDDAWTNPEGSQLTYLAAKEVYDFLGAGDKISIRFRPVGHIPSHEDLLDYADYIFFDKPLPTKTENAPYDFGELAYPVEENAYNWGLVNRR